MVTGSSGCDQLVGPLDVASGCGQWVVDNYTFYLITKYPYSSVSVLFSSLTLTFHSILIL